MRKSVLHIALLIACMFIVEHTFAQTEVSGTWAGGTLTGSYKLMGNTTLTNTIAVASNTTLTVDLNGYVLSGGNNGLVFNVDGTLNIRDSRPTISHQGYVDSNGIFRWTQNIPSGYASIIVNGGIIYNPYVNAETDKKGIAVSGKCYITDAKIVGCYSTRIGAAVTVSSSGSFTMKNGEVRYNFTDSNSPSMGGTIYGEPSHNNQGAIIDISESIISDNKTTGVGGAICGWTVTLDGCTIERNVSSYNGGALYNRSSDNQLTPGKLTIKSSTIAYNTAELNGGGIYVNTDCTIVDSEISNNDAKGTTGGGVYVQNADVTITGSKINGNEAFGSGSQGGGIYVNGDPTLYTCQIGTSEINSNYSCSNGGGIFSRIPTNVSDSKICWNRTMTSNTAEQKTNGGRGGGFHFTGNIECELNNTNVDHNAAMWYGGGGQIDNSAKLTLKGNSTINYNTVVLHGAGGLHLTSEAHLVLESGEISYNEVSTVGGGIHTSYGCFLELNGGRITNNIAHQRGGGVHVNTGGDLVLNGTDIIGNKVYKGYDILYSEVIRNSDGTYTWSTPVADTATSSYELDAEGKLVDSGYGGGVLIDSGTCTMNSGSLSGNYAEKAGGGLGLIMIRMSDKVEDFAILKVVSFTLNNGTISNNTCDGNGAGVYLMRNKMPDMFAKLSSDAQETLKQDPNYSVLINGVPTATIAQGTLRDNVSKVSGAAIMMEKGNFNVTGSTVLEKNISASHGGGIYIGGGTFQIGQSGTLTAQGNQSTNGNGGAIYLGDGTFTSAGTVALGSASLPNSAANGNGGGIYCAGTFTVNGKAIIDHNRAANGAGVCVENGGVSLAAGKGSTILNNTASNMGGGLYVVNTGARKSASFQGGTFTNNTARSGGAVSAVGEIDLTLAATMEGNTASAGNGGAIYMSGGVNMTFGDGLIRANKAQGTLVQSGGTALNKNHENVQGVGGGVFMADNATLKFSNPTEMGIYNNAATNAGADICANGNNTSIELPNISQMSLKGFHVPGNHLYWVEDYFTGESYSTGYNSTFRSGIRYEDALKVPGLDISTYIINYGGSETKKTVAGYTCLDLGYDLVFITLKVIGLLEDSDNVAVTMSYPVTDDNGAVVGSERYRKILITGNSSREVGLPSGDWKIETTEWDYKYSEPTLTPSHAADGYIKIKRTGLNGATDENLVITAEFQARTTTGGGSNVDLSKIKSFEARKVNRMTL